MFMLDWLTELIGGRNLNAEQQRSLRIKILAILLFCCLFAMFAIYMLVEGKAEIV